MNGDDTLPTNFSQPNKTFCLNIHYRQPLPSVHSINARKQEKFTALDSQIVPYKMSMENISCDLSNQNALKTGLYGYVHQFSVEDHVFNDLEMYDIYRYFTRKKGII